jgi:hypothetical protein
MSSRKIRLSSFFATIVIITLVLTPLEPALAAPEAAPEKIGILTVGAILGGAYLAKNFIGDLIGEAGEEAQNTLRETERILDDLIVKLRENYEDALEVTLDQLDEFSRTQLMLIHGLVQDILVQLELAFEEINQTILNTIEVISLELQARIAQIEDVAIVIVRGTILIIDKAAFNLSFVVDLAVLAIGLIVFIVLLFTHNIPTDPLSRKLSLGGIALFMAIFGFFLLPVGRAYALTYSGYGKQIQALEKPDIFQARPRTIIIGETREISLVGTRLAPGGQPPTVEIGDLEAPVVTSDELVVVQVAGLDLSDHLGIQTITLRTENGVDTEVIEILASPPSLADLVITSFVIEPASPQEDNIAQAKIVVSNQGEGAALSFRVRWQPTAALPGELAEVAGLEPGESAEVSLRFTYIRAGDFQSVATVDDFGEVKETDEANNIETLAITVQGIGPTPTPTRVPPQEPSCQAACQSGRDSCLAEGEFLPKLCVQIYQSCLNLCP